MSPPEPLGAGPLGSPDWQSVVNWDGPVLLNQANVEHTGTFTTGIFNVTRYGYLSARLFASVPVAVSVAWFRDPAGTIDAGQRTFTLDPNITQAAQLRMLNLGGFVQLSFVVLSGGPKWKLSGSIAPTNRAYPTELVPDVAVVANYNGPVNGANSVTVWPEAYVGGCVAELFGFSEGPPVNVDIQSLVPTYEYRITGRLILAETTIASAKVVLPVGAWRISLSSGVATAVETRVLPVLSGAG